MQSRFEATSGLDPIFRTNDGSNSPTVDVSTVEARRAAYSLLLSRGLIRVGIAMPPAAEFTLEAVDDPHGFASAAQLSMFRRPLPSTNLLFLSTVMWDGRETVSGETIHFDLGRQANGATVGHAQGAQDLTQAQRCGRRLRADVAHRPDARRRCPRAARAWRTRRSEAPERATIPPAINNPRGPDPTTGALFDRRVFTLFDEWTAAFGRWGGARQAVNRGQALFNERQFVNGRFLTTCSNCHNTPNVGSSSINFMANIGVSDEANRTPDLPLYTLRCTATATIVKTTDPGRALITGRCADIGSFKVPTLRGLAARAPYFHNGVAATLDAVVDFYDRRFSIGLTEGEKTDLTAFLRTL